MNWLRHELRLRAHKVGRAIQFMEEAERRREIMKPQASIHDTKCQIILKRGYVMKENFLVDLSKQFAVDIVNFCTDIKENRKSNVLLNQVLRSGTSIGANIHEANYATSKADFINKFQIALKE